MWPVIQRELRAQARSPMNWRLRLIAVGLATGYLWLLHLSTPLTLAGTAGSRIFYTLHAFALAGIFILCPLLTSDGISRERREGTLFLLFLTPLKSVDIVMGKLAAQALRAYLLWFAVVPLMMFPLLLGGVTGQETALALLLEGLLIALALACSLVISAHSERAWLALLGAYGLLIATLTGLALMTWMELAPNVGPGPAAMVITSLPAGVLWWSAAKLVLLALSAILLLVRITHQQLDRLARETRLPAPTVPKAARREARPLGRGTRGGQRALARLLHDYRRRLLERRPVDWLVCRGHGLRSRGFEAVVWLALVVVAAALVLRAGWNPNLLFLCPLAGMTLLAGRCMADEQETGTLELLLTLPVSEADFLAAQTTRLRRVFLPALLAITALVGVRAVMGQGMWLTPVLVLSLLALFSLPPLGVSLSLLTGHAFVSLAGTIAIAWVVPLLFYWLIWVSNHARIAPVPGTPIAGIGWSFEDVTFLVFQAGIGLVAWQLAEKALRRRDFKVRVALK
jgi:ABC-type transport system involved in multi-copper enzyme maturation permease subunit